MARDLEMNNEKSFKNAEDLLQGALETLDKLIRSSKSHPLNSVPVNQASNIHLVSSFLCRRAPRKERICTNS